MGVPMILVRKPMGIFLRPDTTCDVIHDQQVDSTEDGRGGQQARVVRPDHEARKMRDDQSHPADAAADGHLRSHDHGDQRHQHPAQQLDVKPERTSIGIAER